MTTPGQPTQAGAAAVSTAGWISGPWQDFVLFVGTPLFIVPLIMLAQQAWTAATLYLAVASFGALGHHLPGMMRAYGDRALFDRFKLRFILAPIFLVITCLGFMSWNSSPLRLVLFGWGLWHGFMQAHGIARIYDGKVGSVDTLTIKLDFLLLATWFPSIVLFSALRFPQLVGFFYDCGVPTAPLLIIDILRGTAVIAIVGVTLAYVANAVRRTRAGTPPSPLKLALHVTTLGFWAFCNLFVTDVLLAVLMFEMFHDVQYLTIVWVFNRRRADTDPRAGGFTRFLFRQRGYLGLIYLGMVATYGSLNLLAGGEREAYGFEGFVGGLLITSTFLHFYFDGFIWKLRENETSQTLNLKTLAQSGSGRGQPIVSGASHALKWAYFIVPLSLLSMGIVNAKVPMNDVRRFASLAELSPTNGNIQAKLAEVLARDEDFAGAIEAGRRALGQLTDRGSQANDWATARGNLITALMIRSLSLVEEGELATAAPLVHEAAALDPAVHQKIRDTAKAAHAQFMLPAAGAHFALATLLDPDDVESWVALAQIRRAQGRLDEARSHVEQAHKLKPDDRSITELRTFLGRSR